MLYLVQTDMRQVLDLVATEQRPVVVFESHAVEVDLLKDRGAVFIAAPKDRAE